jgi:multidrug efflux pump subunit AcrB
VRADLATLERLTVPGKNGPVMLGTVATLSMESGPAQIDRLNRSRNVTLDVELGRRQLGDLNEEARALPSLRNLPPGVSIAELGDAQEMQALFASFGIAMLIGVLCIYGVLVLLFHDFMQPVTILAALPLSAGGAFVALLLTGRALSMPSMIGLIMLMGHRHQELDPAGGLRHPGARRPSGPRRAAHRGTPWGASMRWWTPVTNAAARS